MSLDALWDDLIFDALASDGPIRDSDVKDAVKRARPKIEAEAASPSAALRDEFQRFVRDMDKGVGKGERTALFDSALERAQMILGPGLPEGPQDALAAPAAAQGAYADLIDQHMEDESGNPNGQAYGDPASPPLTVERLARALYNAEAVGPAGWDAWATASTGQRAGAIANAKAVLAELEGEGQ